MKLRMEKPKIKCKIGTNCWKNPLDKRENCVIMYLGTQVGEGKQL